MLFLSELESGRAVVALGSIRALPVIEQVVAEVGDRAAAAGLTLEWSARPRSTCRCGRGCCRWSLQNLVENAIRYAGEGATCVVTLRRRARPTAA